MLLMMRSSIDCDLSMSNTAATFSDGSTESGCMRTSARTSARTVTGSNVNPDLPSPDAFLTAMSAAAIIESLSKDVTVPYPHLPPDHALRHTPPVPFSTSCLRFPLTELAPITRTDWDLASANSAPASDILSTAVLRMSRTLSMSEKLPVIISP